jgi:hypothetical protein
MASFLLAFNPSLDIISIASSPNLLFPMSSTTSSHADYARLYNLTMGTRADPFDDVYSTDYYVKPKKNADVSDCIEPKESSKIVSSNPDYVRLYDLTMGEQTNPFDEVYSSDYHIKPKVTVKKGPKVLRAFRRVITRMNPCRRGGETR